MSNYPTSYPQPNPPPQPPKKRHWLPWVITGACLLWLVSCVSILASLGEPAPVTAPTVATSEPVEPSDEPVEPSEETTKPEPKPKPTEEDRNAPREVKPGKAFTVGKHRTLAGWRVVKVDFFGDAMITIKGKVRNVSDDTSTAFLHFKIIRRGEVIANVQCNSSDLEPGQSETLNCIPDGKWGKWSKITAEATF